MKKNKIFFAVIGCGTIGLRHISIINNSENCKLLAVIDKNQKKIENLDQKKIPFFYDLDGFFESSIEVDVMVIATPNGLHSDHALKSLENNCHVLVEKPMALFKQDAEKIIYKSIQMKKNVFVVMQNRYSPPIKWIKNVLHKKVLGEIYMVNVNCFWNRDERYYENHEWHGNKKLDGGTLYTQFSHFIDIIYWLFGDIKNISSKFFNFNHVNQIEFEDSGFINFDFLKGGSCNLNYTTSVWDKNLESSMTIIAENGSVTIGGQYMDKVLNCHIKNYEMEKIEPTNSPNIYEGYVGSAQNHQYVIQNVVDVLNNSQEIKTNAIEGLKVTEIIENIYSKVKNDFK